MPVAFLDLAQYCAPQVATETIAAVVSVESGFQPFAIRINTDHPLAEQPKTRAEAIETATILIAEGHDIDLGLGGLNSGNLGRLGLSVSDTFDFCLNIKASASLLEGYYQIALQGGATTAQAEVVMLRSYFGNGDASVGEMVGYDKKVLAERARLSSQLDRIEIVEAQAQALPARERAGGSSAATAESGSVEQSQQRSQASVPRWDVYNAGRQSSVLVFPMSKRSDEPMNLSARIRPYAAMAAVFSLTFVEPSFAQAGGIESVLQNIVNMLTGNVARLLAIIAVIIVGIAWMFGYLDLRKAAFVVLGIGIIFGATEIVNMISGG